MKNLKNILTITKKELRGYFDNPTAYIVLIVFLLLWEFLFFRGAFLVGEASLRSLMDILPWLFLFLIPAITMGSISQEKSEGTLELLLTRPIKDWELLAGKFLGSAVFISIALLFIFPIAWSFSRFGNLDWGVVISQYLGGVFMGMVLVALGIFVSGIFSSQISSLLVTAVGSFLLVSAGFGFVTDRLPLALASYAEQLSVLSHFQSMSRGVIDSRDLWYFISITAAFLSLAYLWLVRRRFGGQKSAYRNCRLGVILIIGIAVLTNIVGARIPGRIDLTQNKIYTLTKTTREILGGLNDVVNITFFSSKKLPAQLQPVLRDTKDTLLDYQILGKGNVVISYKDPSSDPEAAKEAESMGIQKVRFNVVSEEEFQVKSGYLGLVVSYGGASESIPFIQNTGDLEYQLTGFIKKLTTEDKKRIGFIAGYGGKNLSTNFRLLKEELEKQFEVEEIAAKGEDAKTEESDKQKEGEKEDMKKLEIPEDIAAIVVAGPTEKISGENRAVIKNFLDEGGSALFLIDPVIVSPQTLSAAPNKESLADFLKENYGLKMNQNLVFDLKSNETVNFGSAGGFNYLMPYPFWIRAIKADQRSPIITKIESVVMPWASSISVDDDKVKKSGIVVTNLLETTKFGGAQKGTFSITPEQEFSKENLSRKIMAISLIKSSENADENARKTRIVAVGDSDFLTDQFVKNSPQNLAFGTESLSWLAQEESLAGIQLKSRAERKLLFENNSQINAIKFGNMGAAFLIPLVIGVFRIYRRKRMRELSFRA